MNEEMRRTERKGRLAAAAGLAMPGLGQIYNGELLKGASLFVIFIMALVIGLRLSVLLPDRLLTAGVSFALGTAIALYVFSVLDALKKTEQQHEGYTLKPYNRWYFYMAFWMLGSVLVTGAALEHTKANFVQAYKIVTESMSPVVFKGDRVLADKTAYKRMPPRKGDIVIFIFPDDRSKVYIKRIAGLPGDTVRVESGRDEKVPHGYVYVLGDSRQQSVDSRNFGLVPLRDVVGKVRQVYFSSGPEGIRWNRIGTTFEGGTQ